MKIALREVEPFNIPPVNNQEAAMFTKKLTGREVFEFRGSIKPKSLIVYSLKYNYPNACFLYGELLSDDVDSFLSICKSGRYPNLEEILKKYSLGFLTIEIGGNRTEPLLYVT